MHQELHVRVQDYSISSFTESNTRSSPFSASLQPLNCRYCQANDSVVLYATERSTCHVNSMLITIMSQCATLRDKTCVSVIVRAG